MGVGRPHICIQFHTSGQVRHFLNRDRGVRQGLRLWLGGFLGRLPKERLEEVRARCAVVVVGSRFEAFTLVAGEAFISRCPVILSDRAGWRGLAERFHAARLFSLHDPEDLAEAMFEVEDPTKRAALQEGGDKIAAYLSSEELFGKTVSFYQGLLQ
jgi:glycosyltransferase involved in cell wall biosynthesis